MPSIEDLVTRSKVYANLILDICNHTREELGIAEFRAAADLIMDHSAH